MNAPEPIRFAPEGPQPLVRAVPPGAFPPIPFEEIGLIRDGFRQEVPDKAAYRSAVRLHHEGTSSFSKGAKYDPRNINRRIYFDSAGLLRRAGGMLH